MHFPISKWNVVVMGFLLWILQPAFAQDYNLELNEALAVLNAGDYQRARDLFHPLIEKVSGNDREYVMGYFETFLETGEYAAGLEQVESYLQKSPGDPFLLNMKGEFLIVAGRYSETEEAFLQSGKQKSDYWRNIFDTAELYGILGRRREANALYNTLVQQYTMSHLKTARDIGMAAKAMAALGEFHEANDAFLTANKIEPENVYVLQMWAELFAGKFNPDQARANYEEALEINPNAAGLLTGYARVVESFAAKEELARSALEKNPGSIYARNILAEIYIVDSQYDEAEQELKRALEINPNSIETLAYLAAVYHLRDEQGKFAEVEKRVLNINPNAGDFYYTIADNCVRRFRYKDAVSFGYQAIQRDPKYWKTYALVGVNLLRIGQVQTAYRYLSSAYENDPFNLFARNSLNLIDEYSNFETMESEHFTLILHESESGILGQAVLDLAETCYDSLARRYPYRPSGKILIEGYNDHADFAVRISGLPGIGLLGVCFGDVVAFDTPEARLDYAAQMGLPENRYNWSRTLWHELAHVMALGLSDHRVPRWFTEGLSVYEEKRAQPEWARDMELEFYAALDQKRLLSLQEMNEGFTRPRYPGQIMLSYYHASRLIEFVAEKYGFETITTLLVEFGKGYDLEKSFREVLKTTPETIDREFLTGLRSEMRILEKVIVGMPGISGDEEHEKSSFERLTNISPVRENPFFTNIKEGHDLLKKENYSEAEEKFLRAIELFPNFIEPGNPYEGLAEIYRVQGNSEKLRNILEQYLSVSEYGGAEARELADMFREKGMLQEAEYYYNRSLQVEPYEISTYTRLAEMYASRKLYPNEIDQRRIIVALEPLDKSQAYYFLGVSLLNNGQYQDAKMAALKSLEIAPGFREAQKLLLQCIKTPD